MYPSASQQNREWKPFRSHNLGALVSSLVVVCRFSRIIKQHSTLPDVPIGVPAEQMVETPSAPQTRSPGSLSSGCLLFQMATQVLHATIKQHPTLSDVPLGVPTQQRVDTLSVPQPRSPGILACGRMPFSRIIKQHPTLSDVPIGVPTGQKVETPSAP